MNKERKHRVAIKQPLTGKKINLSPLLSLYCPKRWEEREMGKGMNKKSKHGVAMDKPLTGNKINLSPLVFPIYKIKQQKEE